MGHHDCNTFFQIIMEKNTGKQSSHITPLIGEELVVFKNFFCQSVFALAEKKEQKNVYILKGFLYENFPHRIVHFNGIILKTVEWSRAYLDGEDMVELTDRQIREFFS